MHSATLESKKMCLKPMVVNRSIEQQAGGIGGTQDHHDGKGITSPFAETKQKLTDNKLSLRKRSPRTSRKSKSTKLTVIHSYHDYCECHKCGSQDKILNVDEGRGIQQDSKDKAGSRGGVATPFPIKLHIMLSRAKTEEFDHIVSWQPHGRCFKVHEPKKFITSITPRWFKQSKLTSFQRQLNLYGFYRLTTGPDRGA
jgi:hypothetical protein